MMERFVTTRAFARLLALVFALAAACRTAPPPPAAPPAAPNRAAPAIRTKVFEAAFGVARVHGSLEGRAGADALALHATITVEGEPARPGGCSAAEYEYELEVDGAGREPAELAVYARVLYRLSPAPGRTWAEALADPAPVAAVAVERVQGAAEEASIVARRE